MTNDRFPSYRYPITYHVMEDYKLLISGNPESAELLNDLLSKARQEVTEAKDIVPVFRTWYTDADDTKMLDALIALVGEGTTYDIHLEQEDGCFVQYITFDNLALLPSILVVNALGIVNHWADPAIPGKVKIFFESKWAEYEEFYGPIVEVMQELIEERKVLPGIKEVSFYIDDEE